MRFFFLLLFGFVPFLTRAQTYQSTFGLRLDSRAFGLTAVHRIARHTSLEGIGLLEAKSATGIALVREHFPILTRRLNWYVGLGAHVGALKDVGNFWGVDGQLGAEYKFNLLPIHISFDVRPCFHVNGHPDWFEKQTAFSIRYVLVKSNGSRSRPIWKRVRDWFEEQTEE